MIMMIMVLLLECLKKCSGACNDKNGSMTRVLRLMIEIIMVLLLECLSKRNMLRCNDYVHIPKY